jgi:hypothetical protein
VWGKCILYAKNGLPIPRQSVTPPLFPLTFISDAAGAVHTNSEVHLPDASLLQARGVASVGFQEQQYFFTSILYWPEKFVQQFPSNSTLLETIGLLLPFISIPQHLLHRSILLLVDNEAVVYAWSRRMSPHSPLVSILIQALHLIEVALPCRIYVQHIPRCSTEPACLVDALS